MPTFSVRYFVITSILVLLAFIIGLLLGKFSYNAPKQISQKQASLANPLFSTQQATIRGKITKVEGSMLTVQNNLGVNGQVRSAPVIYITKYDEHGKPQSFSSLKDIETGRNVIVNLELPRDTSEYIVVAITFLPPLPK